MRKKVFLLFIISLTMFFIYHFMGNSAVSHVTLPFSEDQVAGIDLYYYEGAPAAAEVRHVTAEDEIHHILSRCAAVSLIKEDNTPDDSAGGSAVIVRFLLRDGSDFRISCTDSYRLSIAGHSYRANISPLLWLWNNSPTPAQPVADDDPVIWGVWDE